MSKRDVVFPAGRQALYEQNRYSPAIRSNGFLFVSGQVGSLPDGSPEPDVESQVRLAFGNLNAVLEAAGCTFDDVIDVTVFILDPESNLEKVWKVIPEFWGAAPHPTLTGVGVSWLYGFQFEIKVIAKLPDPAQKIPFDKNGVPALAVKALRRCDRFAGCGFGGWIGRLPSA